MSCINQKALSANVMYIAHCFQENGRIAPSVKPNFITSILSATRSFRNEFRFSNKHNVLLIFSRIQDRIMQKHFKFDENMFLRFNDIHGIILIELFNSLAFSDDTSAQIVSLHFVTLFQKHLLK